MSQTKAQLIDNLVSPITGALGSASAPTFSFTADPNTGLYSPGADQVAISTGGSGRLFVDASGNVSIGTSSPAAQFVVGSGNTLLGHNTLDNYGGRVDIRSAYQARSANVPAQLFVADSTGSQLINTGGAIDLGGYQDSFSRAYSYARIQGLASASTGYGGYLSFMTQNAGGSIAECLRIDSSGRVGIGTTTVRTPLHVKLATDKNVGFDLDGANEARILAFNDAYTSTTPLCINGEDLRFQVQGGEKARIDSSGRLGIGTSTPAYTLVAKGGVATTGIVASIINPVSGGNSKIHFTDDATYNWTAGTVGNAFAITPSEASTSSGTPALYINSSGRLGIGTTSPSEALHVKSTSGTQLVLERDGTTTQIASVVFKDGSGDQNRISSSDSNLIFESGAGNTERLRITAAGLVGIGTTSPSDPNGFGNCIDIRSPTGAAIYLRDSDDTVNDAFVIGRDNSDSYLISASGNMLFSNNGSERARIDSSGRLLIGVSSSYANADVDELQIGNNSSATKTGITLGSTDQSGIAFADASNARAGMIEYTHSIDSLRFYTNGTNERMRINSGGAVVFWSQLTFAPSGTKAFEITYNAADFYITNADFSNYAYLSGQNFTGWSFASDARIKENIQDLEYGINQLKALKPRRFNFIGQDSSTIGFIAQEVQAVVPEAVTGKEIPYEETDTLQEKASKTLSITKEALIPLLTKALQEAIAKIETLEGMVAVNNITIDEQQHQISALADRLTALEAQ
jgi:hypothetical protein